MIEESMKCMDLKTAKKDFNKKTTEKAYNLIIKEWLNNMNY